MTEVHEIKECEWCDTIHMRRGCLCFKCSCVAYRITGNYDLDRSTRSSRSAIVKTAKQIDNSVLQTTSTFK